MNDIAPKPYQEAGFNRISALVQQAYATLDVLQQCCQSEKVKLPGCAPSTLDNVLWSVMDQLEKIQSILNEP
jgi:hypothetical protein